MTPHPARLVADPDRMVQTLTNLLSNAIKFSQRGGTVRMETERQGDEILFRISDEGRGVPEDKQESVFGRFAQVNATDSSCKGGTFQFTLPLAAEPENGAPIAKPQEVTVQTGGV